jgi:hypothetical protein
MKMRKWILVLAGLLISAGAQARVLAVPYPDIGSIQDAHKAAFFMPQTYLSPLVRGDVICDLTTGVATGVGAGTCVAHPATCNGTADDAQAFADFMTWANLTWQAAHTGLVELFIPSGKTCMLKTDVSLTASSFDPGCATPATYGFNCSWVSGRFSKGIRKFLLNFTGSSVNADGVTVFFFLAAGDGVCHHGIGDANGCSARTATASTGATSVTLLNTSLCSRFTVGNYVIMSGYDVQGQFSATSAFGYPPNPAFYDYAVVTSTASCAGSGVINLDRALTNDYKSTWPSNCPGGLGEADCGGPATLYALPFWWNTEVEYRGGTFNDGPNQTGGGGRSMTFRSITWGGSGACTPPSQSIDWTVIGGDWSICTLEMDKIVTNASFQGALVNRLDHQSMSPRYVTITSGSTVGTVSGTPRDFRISNSTISSAGSIGLGPTGFGRADYFSSTNSVVNSSPATNGASESGTVSAGVWPISGQAGGPYNATMTGGVITIPNTHGAVTWAVPGSNIVFAYSGVESTSVYQVSDVTQDVTNQYVTTNCVGVNTVCGVGGGLPVSSGSLLVRSHPAPKFTCSGGSGGTFWSAVCNGPANVPIYSYQKYTADVSIYNRTGTLMLPDPKVKCPATGFAKSCHSPIVTKCTCPKFVHIRGKDPQTGADVDKHGCVDSFLPMLLLENAQMSRQTAAAVESFRNEIVQAERDKQALLAQFTNARGITVVK